MKNLVFIALLTSSLLGCANERYFGGNGAEAIVYKENHSFEFAIKKRTETAKKIEQLIRDIESMDKGATYVVEYKSTRAKTMLEPILSSIRHISSHHKEWSIALGLLCRAISIFM